MRSAIVSISMAAALMSIALPAAAQARQGGLGMAGGAVEAKYYDVKASGLAPVFPENFSCDPIASPFGSATRFDGGQRRQDRNSGLHGGLDISLKEGTPLLAVAAGKVIAKGEGGNLEGNYLWLQHSPSDTGLPYWAYTKYQHLREVPSIKLGERVTAGQIIAMSGMTGTVGPAFGPSGYAHLHLGLFVAPDSDYVLEGAYQSTVSPKGGRLSDPMLMYLAPNVDIKKVAELPDEKKRISVAIMDAKGQIQPAGSKTIWPIQCAATSAK